MSDGPSPAPPLPLSLLVDRLLGPGPRGRAPVREFSGWLQEHAAFLHLAPLDALGLIDVVVTFRMKQVVTLVATGRRPDVPGEVTVSFVEADFPFIDVHRDATPRAEPYLICTLDHAVEGRPVRLLEELRTGGRLFPAGTRGRALLDTTVDGRRHLRLQLDPAPDDPVNVDPALVGWLDEHVVVAEVPRGSPSDDRATGRDG